VGSFCATPCSLEGACPDGGICQPVDGAEVCVPEEGECTCSSRAILDGASTTCALENDFGSCGGTRTCEAEGLTACDAVEPSIESCNDLDDDCDGLVDEDFAGKGESCDGEDVDVCLDGVLVCGDGGLVCDDDEAAATETCNDEDDDCDGLVDEDFGDKGEACDGNDADLCEDGIWACENLALVCQDGEESGEDICNGLDDDCDDKVDEGFPTVGEPCDGPDSDLCLKGTFSCTADGSAVECVNEAVVDILDTCDGVDNDCNPGTVDGFHDAGFAAPCDGADSDLCAEGILVCDGVSLALVCTDDSADSLDLCDGQDNDCDPGTPDGSAEATFEAPCDGADSDLCEEGILACDGTALVCTDDDGENDVEACNELDDDCNGIIDDKDSDTDQHVDVACTAYDGGLPADDCEDGNPAIHGGVDEVADGVDNNCNGQVDEGTEFFDDDGDCFCETGPCTGSNSKGCNNVSPGDCNDGDNTVNPAAVDHPDPDHGDQNCDGVDGDLGDSVFLSPSAGLDINNGVTPDSPVQTLNVAYAVAAAASRGWILIEGTGSLSLAGSFMEGVNLAAGYQSGSDWQNRTSADGPTVSVSASGTVISGWSTPTQWQQMVIEAGDAQGTSASSIALRVHDSQALSFIDCTFIAGDATAGGGGASGTNGTFGGTKGSNGGNGCEDSGG
ncbi:MAG: putative metal-binding motif-containing protein, partial [Myxococcota bacterium]|nr:putative metal-binding motif-containing protein [Myxococcota bacterium]